MDNKARWRAYDHAYRAKQITTNTKDYRMRKVFYSRRAWCRNNNVPFSVTLSDLQSLPSEICPILGVELVWGGRGPNSVTLDKKVPDKGYIEGNVHWISFRANRLKNDSTKEENVKLYEWFQTI